ncbi:MAG: BACON domain-containing protein, partial [Planctomycetota bacterium]
MEFLNQVKLYVFVSILSVTVFAAPPTAILELSSNGYNFSALEAGANPGNQLLTISNTGNKTLNWSIDTTGKPTWLTITPISGSLADGGSEPATLSVDITGLSAGQYSYVFDVSDPAAQNSPQSVTVNLDIDGPIIGLSATTFNYTADQDGPNPSNQTLTVSNSGGGTLNWSITDVNIVTFSPPAWLTIMPVSGALNLGQSEPVTLSVDHTGLSLGQYSYAFDVSDPNAQNSTQTISIELYIVESSLGDIFVPADQPTIQAGIDAAVNGDIVVVLPRTYVESINFNGKNITLTSMDPDDSNVVDATIIDGGAVDTAVTFAGTETAACQLRGFTITNGDGYDGGGINGNFACPTISNCIITGNTAGDNGGGLYTCDGVIINCAITGNTASGSGAGLAYCNGTISNCTITGNTTSFSGGGLHGCNGMIANCTITENTASQPGGGLAYCNGTISNCTITGNTTSITGGGLQGGNGSITNCTIVGNWADMDGGGLNNFDGSITNCTIADNWADDGGGLKYCDGPVTNCILWGNGANAANSYGDQLLGGSTPTYSLIQNWTGGGTGNIDGNPLFADTTSPIRSEWDLHLLSGSPCIDAGTNAPPGGLPDSDIVGFPRPLDGDYDGALIADMGAYEFLLLDEPYVYVAPAEFTFSALQGADPNDQEFTIQNLSGGTMYWSITDANEATFSPPIWLTITPTSGTLSESQSETVTLSVEVTGLSAGSYSYAFEVADPNAQNGSQIATVELYTTDAVGDIYVPSDYPTIQTAIDAAVNG